jgi:hypothetical protein
MPPPPTYLESLAGSIAGHASLLPWVLASALGLAVSAWIFSSTRHWIDLGTVGAFALTLALVPAAMRIIFSILWEWTQRVKDFVRVESAQESGVTSWICKQFDVFLDSIAPLAFGIVYAAFALFVYDKTGAFTGLSTRQAMASAVVVWLGSFVCGVGLTSIFYLGRFIWRLGRRYPIRVTPHAHGIISTGDTLLQCYLIVAVVWAVYTSSAVWNLSGRVFPLLALSLPALTGFVSSFIICQIPLHERMVEEKRARLKELDTLLQNLSPVQIDELTEVRREQVAFCVAEIDRVANWPEWPFRLRSFSGVVGAAFGAVAPSLFDLVLPRLIGKR